MRKQFWHLYKKELREGAPFAIVLGILILGLLIFLTTTRARWGREVGIFLSFAPLGLLPFYALFQGFTAFRGEWKEDTVFTILSLPVPGWFFCLTKWLASMTYFTVLTVLNIVLIGLFNWSFVGEAFANIPSLVGFLTIVKLVTLMYLAYWLCSGISYIIGQFSFLTSRLVNKGKAILSGLTALTSCWIIFRVGGLFTRLFAWLPEMHVGIWNYQNGFYRTDFVALDLAPWLALVLVAAGLLFLGAWLLERILEV